MIFGGNDEDEEEYQEKIEKATKIVTDFGTFDKATVLAAAEFYERNKIRKTKYRRSDKGKNAKRRELDGRLLSHQLINMVRKGLCICGKFQNECKDLLHINMVNQYKQIIK